MNESVIILEVKKLLLEFMGIKYKELIEINVSRGLQILLSVSSQAVAFVTLLEDEFGIEFEDEEIDVEFFNDIKVVSNLIMNKLNN
jgi:acyl carrier protein